MNLDHRREAPWSKAVRKRNRLANHCIQCNDRRASRRDPSRHPITPSIAAAFHPFGSRRSKKKDAVWISIDAPFTIPFPLPAAATGPLSSNRNSSLVSVGANAYSHHLVGGSARPGSPHRSTWTYTAGIRSAVQAPSCVQLVCSHPLLSRFPRIHLPLSLGHDQANHMNNLRSASYSIEDLLLL